MDPEFDVDGLRAVDSEGVHQFRLMLSLVLPGFVEQFHGADARHLEALVQSVGCIIGPDLSVYAFELFILFSYICIAARAVTY